MSNPAEPLPLDSTWWLPERPLGSIIEISRVRPGYEFTEYLNRGWRGLHICTDPKVTAMVVDTVGTLYPGRGLALNAHLNLTDARVEAAGGALLLAGLHPNQLGALWAEPDPPLPYPRVVVMNVPDNGLRLLDILTQWVAVDAIKLSVVDDNDAKAAGEWLGAAWRVDRIDGYTVHAHRAFPA